MVAPLAFEWANISGGSVLIVIAILSFAVVVFKASPIGHDAAESWKNLAEGRKEELDEARDDAAERFAEVERLKVANNELKVSLARCEERPSTEQLAHTITAMQEGFSSHRDDLLHTQNRILAHLETSTEAIKSMEQALTLVAERLHADATPRRDV